MSDVFNVLPSDTNKRHVLFSGMEEDARTFIENNYPRIHAEPQVHYGDDGPAPDVVMVPDGHKADSKEATFYNGHHWSDDEDYMDEPEPEDKNKAASSATKPKFSDGKV